MGTHHQGTVAEVRALNTYIALMRASRSTTARVHGHLADTGLTLGQFAALEALHHLGPMLQTALAGKLLCSAGNLTVVLDNLEDRGLVSRGRVAEDRRCVRVRVSATGSRLIRRIFPRHVRALVDDLAILSPREQETLRTLCRRLGRQAR